MSTYFILLYITLFGACFSVKLPTYIEKCGFTNAAECILKQSSKVISEIVKGYRPLHIPSLDPYHVTKISIQATKLLNITLADLDIYGLGNSRFEKFEVDVEKREVSLKLFVHHIDLIGIYDVNGKVLLLDIMGNGQINMAAINATFSYVFDWDTEQKPDGNMYFVINDSKLDYTIERLYFHLDNLFNGNKELGDQLNKFINENWKDFAHDIYPAITKTISDVIKNIFKAFELIPASELIQ